MCLLFSQCHSGGRSCSQDMCILSLPHGGCYSRTVGTAVEWQSPGLQWACLLAGRQASENVTLLRCQESREVGSGQISWELVDGGKGLLTLSRLIGSHCAESGKIRF